MGHVSPVLVFVGWCDADGFACDESVATHYLANIEGQTVMRERTKADNFALAARV